MGLLVAGAHAQHATPRVGGLARVGDLRVPESGDLAREVGADGRVLAAEDLILDDLHQRAVVGERAEQRLEVGEHARVARRQVVEALEIERRPGRVGGDVAAQRRAAREQQAHVRAVEHLGQRAIEGRLLTSAVARPRPERVERVERGRFDVRDERVAEPGEGLSRVAEIVLCGRGRAPQQRRARAPAVARRPRADREGLGQHAPHARAPERRVRSSRRDLERSPPVVGRHEPSGHLEEAARPIRRAALHGLARRSRERERLVGGAPNARRLSLPHVERLFGRRRERRDAREERLRVRERHAREPGLPLRDRLGSLGPRLHQHLGLAHALGGARDTGERGSEQVVRHEQRLAVAELDGERLELGCDAGLGRARRHQLEPDLQRLFLASHADQPLERGEQRRCALRALGRGDVPLEQLGGDEPLPAEPVAELDERAAAVAVAGVGHRRERGQRVVAPVEPVGEDLGALLRQRRELDLVPLDLDERGQQLGEPLPLLGGLAEGGEALQRVEVAGLERAHQLEAARRGHRVAERALVEAGERTRHLGLRLVVHGDGEPALERRGHAGGVAAVVFECCDARERDVARRVELAQDRLVAVERAVAVARELEQRSLAHEHRRAHRGVGRERSEPLEPGDRQLVGPDQLGVGREPGQRLGVVAVVEHARPRGARRLDVTDGVGEQPRRARAQRHAQLAIGHGVGPRGQELRDVRGAASVGVALLERDGVGLVGGVGRGGLLEPPERAGLVAHARQELGLGREQRRACAVVRSRVHPRCDHLGRAAPRLGAAVSVLGGLPLARLSGQVGGGREAVGRAREVALALLKRGDALEERALHRAVVEQRRVRLHRLDDEVDAPRRLEQPHRVRERGLVTGTEPRHARPRLACCDRVLPLVLVQVRGALLDGDLRLDVGGRRGVALEGVREIVPAPGALEQPTQVLAGGIVAAIERGDLPPRGDGAVDVAKLRLAQARDLAQLRLARLGERAGGARRARQHLAKLDPLAQATKLILDGGERLGVAHVDREHLAVRGVGLLALAVLRERLGLGEHLRDAVELLGARRVQGRDRLLGGDVHLGLCRVDVHRSVRRLDLHRGLRRIDLQLGGIRLDVHLGRHASGLARRVEVDWLGDRIEVDPLGERVEIDTLGDRHGGAIGVGRRLRDRRRRSLGGRGRLDRSGVRRRRLLERSELYAGVRARLVGEQTRRIGREVGRPARRQLAVAAERPRPVGRELHRSIVARREVERSARVREAVLAVVRLGERHERRHGCVALRFGRLLPRSHELEHRAGELLRQRRVVRRERVRAAERRHGARAIAHALPHVGLVAQQRRLARGVLDEGELGLVQRERVAPLLGLLVELARREHGVRRRRVELARAAVAVERLLRVGERRLGPEATELLVHRRERGLQLARARRERRERARAALEERGERARLALLAVQRGEPLGRSVLGRVLVDGEHEHARGAVHVADRHLPHRCRLGEPMARERGVARPRADALEQRRVGARVGLSGVVRIRDGLAVMRVRDEALHDGVDFARVHAARTLPRCETASQCAVAHNCSHFSRLSAPSHRRPRSAWC